MSWVARGEDFLGRVSEPVLHRAFVCETNVRARTRLHAALLRKQGKKVEEIARTFGTTKSAVSKWLNRLHYGGIKAAMPVKQTGRPKRLPEEQLRVLKKDFLKKPIAFGYPETFWTTRLVQEHVSKKFGVAFVSRHMTRLLHKIGFSLQKPRPSDYRANKAAQNRFKKNSFAWFPNT